MGTTHARATSEARTVAPGVTVCWHDALTDADEALRTHVAVVVGVEPGSVDVGRLCGQCGSSEHGRPWAAGGVHVSLARSGPHLVTAVSASGPVGVDVASVADVDRAWDDVSSLVGGQTPEDATARAALWCRTEAALKRAGTGFSTTDVGDMAAGGHVGDLGAPPGFCAAVAYDASDDASSGRGGSSVA
jgi:4'-phosphopantetheinyl transferase